MFTAISSLPFGGVNFSWGIIHNRDLGFQKDSASEFLKNPRYNWRKFLLGLVTVVVRFKDVLTSEQREKVLSIDDSTYAGPAPKWLSCSHGYTNKRQWLAILSTKVDLADEEIVRISGKRWDIEVFFKMMKHYLNLEREAQLRYFDGIIGRITIVMSRSIFLAFEQRCHDDPRTLGSLFYACSEE